MPEFTTIKEYIERRTYIKGKFYGKFMGFFDPNKSDVEHENFYDLEILSGNLFVKKKDCFKWETGEPEIFQKISKFLTKFPDNLYCEITNDNGEVKHYTLSLNEPKLSDYVLINQLHEGNKVFGDISGEISGYIIHYDVDVREIEIPDNFTQEPIIIPPLVKTSKRTGKEEWNGNYFRYEYYYSDGTAYWGDWQYKKDKSDFSFWSFLGGMLQLLFFLIFIIPIIVYGWKIILPLIIIGGIFYILSLLQPLIVRVWNWIIQILGIGLVLFFILGIFTELTEQDSYIPKKKYATNSIEEVKTEIPDVRYTGDTIISHHRIWNDYQNNQYSANIEVRMTDYKNATRFRNNLPIEIQTPNQYNDLVTKIYDFEKNKLSNLYAVFDSLKFYCNLDKMQFAEVITTCIQDIPYTLILSSECNSNLYNDPFINDYLREGNQCVPNIKYGLLSPIEFLGSLIGDCDTRTLLLFTILNHYGYDVAMLGSELYKHSVIAINLPYKGVTKTINGRRYIIWETTYLGIEPGVFPKDMSDMRFWNVNLISKNQSI
ncbi:MAG: hypothetical protein R2730_10460 [Chitinophagales bacterium]